ncbi:MAG: OsmC family protein [Actinomycetota bacterium]
MPEKPEKKDAADYIVVNRARGRMLSPTSAEIVVRDHAPIVADEPPARGGENRGPTPLEFVLVALCA